MGKGKLARIAGFTVAAGATASLVGFAATGTGAYFTDSANGTMHSTTGHVRVSATHTSLNFTDLLPGDYQNQTVNYTTNSTQSEDIWLYFPVDNQAEKTGYGLFTGNAHDGITDTNGSEGGLGRYGHFAVSNSGGQTVFSSYNLQDSDAADTTSSCADGNGQGSDSPATSVSDTPALCGVPHYILLDSNVPNGTAGHATLTFGPTGRATDQSQTYPDVSYEIVATQHGVRPDAPNF